MHGEVVMVSVAWEGGGSPPAAAARKITPKKPSLASSFCRGSQMKSLELGAPSSLRKIEGFFLKFGFAKEMGLQTRRLRTVPLEATARMHHRKLMALDRFWQIEESTISHICSTSGAQHLRQMYRLQCMPSDEYEMSLEEACEEADKFVKRGVYLWAHATAQSEVMEARQLLVSLRSGSPPSLSTTASPFVQRMYSDLRFFVRVELEVIGDDDDKSEEKMKQVLIGAEALHDIWNKVVKNEKAVLSDYKVPALYRHLLSGDQQQQLDERLTKLYGGAKMGEPAEAATSSGSSKRVNAAPAAKGKAKSKAKAKAAPRLPNVDGTALAMNLLGL